MFTIQQIQEIARKLALMSKKDSDFKPLDTWKSLNGQDYMAFVKDGANRTVTVDQLYTYVRQNVNGDIGDALERIDALETAVQGINEVLGRLTTKYTLTVTPVTPNATVFINGVRQNSMEVTSGSTVNVKVSAEGYDTYEEFVLVESDITLNPDLSQSQVTLTIAASPSDSVVRLNGVVRSSITVPTGTLVNWEVSRAGYVTKSGSETVETSYTLPVTLEAIGGDEVTLTINPTPADADVELNGVPQRSITVDYNTSVHIKVSKDGYKTHEEDYTVTSTETKNITLTQIVETSWTDLALAQADTSENPIGSVPESGGKFSLKASVTAHFNDGSTGVKDVTSQVQWSVDGEGCTSNGGGVFTWTENTSTSTRSATVTANVTGPGSSSLNGTIQTTQQGGDETLEMEPSTLTFESAGGTQKVQIWSNTSWSIE